MDPEKRLSWKDFFNHPLFAEHKAMKAIFTAVGGQFEGFTQMFDKVKEDLKNSDDNETLIQEEFEGNAEAQLISEIEAPEIKTYEHEISSRYEHEYQRILHILTGVQK